MHRFFDPWTGPLSTRFAATFVLVAGVGVTLLTRAGSIGDRAARPPPPAGPSCVAGLVLYGGGLLLDEIWDGTILPYYGAMFVVAAAALHAVARRWIVAVGAGAALAGALDRVVAARAAARRPRHRAGSMRPDRTRRVASARRVRQRHPSAAAVAGVPVRRHRPRPLLGHAGWRPVAIGLGAVLFVLATLLSVRRRAARCALLSTDPWSAASCTRRAPSAPR